MRNELPNVVVSRLQLAIAASLKNHEVVFSRRPGGCGLQMVWTDQQGVVQVILTAEGAQFQALYEAAWGEFTELLIRALRERKAESEVSAA